MGYILATCSHHRHECYIAMVIIVYIVAEDLHSEYFAYGDREGTKYEDMVVDMAIDVISTILLASILFFLK